MQQQMSRVPHRQPPRSVHRHRPPVRSQRQLSSRYLLIGGMVAAGIIGLLVSTAVLLIGVMIMNNTVAAGVTIDGVTVGGQRLNTLNASLLATFADQPVRLVDGERTWQTTARELGLQFNLDETLAALQAASANTQVTPVYQVDLNQAQQTLASRNAEINIEAVPGRDAQFGRAMEIPVMLDRLRVDAYGELRDGVFELTMMDIDPPDIQSEATYTGARTTHRVEEGQELALIAKEYGVDMADIIALNEISNADIIYPGQELLIPASGVFTPDADSAPDAPLQTGKSILVDTGTQRIYAYENGNLLRSHLTSTGRTQTPTVLGDYKIYVKYERDDMRGADYFLPDVPYTMYFYQGYGIHGTYWHNSFGRPMSHGCVNLPVDEAQWFYNFADVGTLVRVI